MYMYYNVYVAFDRFTRIVANAVTHDERISIPANMKNNCLCTVPANAIGVVYLTEQLITQPNHNKVVTINKRRKVYVFQ